MLDIENNNDGTFTINCTQEEYEKLMGNYNSNSALAGTVKELQKRISKMNFFSPVSEPLGSFVGNYITKVIYQNPATIVFWSDGTKTVAKCDENDTFDEEKGLILCIMKKVFPNKNIGTLLGMWTSGSADTYGKNTITLKQARKMEKEFSVYWNAVTRKKGK